MTHSLFIIQHLLTASHTAPQEQEEGGQLVKESPDLLWHRQVIHPKHSLMVSASSEHRLLNGRLGGYLIESTGAFIRMMMVAGTLQEHSQRRGKALDSLHELEDRIKIGVFVGCVL